MRLTNPSREQKKTLTQTGQRKNGQQPEPPVGFEPTTARLRIESSTPELRWQIGNALERTRTAMPFGTTPSRWRVYQFHHQGKLRIAYCVLL